MMGLHHEGGLRPKDTYAWPWDTTRNQDMLWLGQVNGGLRMKWKAENYVRPLINIYYNFGPIHLPTSWGNQGAGGVTISEQKESVLVNAYSGKRQMKKDEVLHYDFELLITPFRTVDKKVQFGEAMTSRQRSPKPKKAGPISSISIMQAIYILSSTILIWMKILKT